MPSTRSDRPATRQPFRTNTAASLDDGGADLWLLASFEAPLSLERRSGFVEPASALKTLSLSEGTFSEISALLCRAALDAIERGTEQITGASLERCGYITPSQRRYAAIN
jgi:hypothetical protein